MFQIFQSPRKSQKVRSKAAETSRSSSCPSYHNSEARQSLARVTEIQKFAKVLPHCSSAVRLNHLARCKPLQPLTRPGGGGTPETFQDLFEKMTEMAVTNSNSQLPLPTNNYPRIPRKKKHKKPSSKRTAATTRTRSAPAIVVSQIPPQHGEKKLMKKDSASRNPLLNDELRNNQPATPPFNFVSS